MITRFQLFRSLGLVVLIMPIASCRLLLGIAEGVAVRGAGRAALGARTATLGRMSATEATAAHRVIPRHLTAAARAGQQAIRVAPGGALFSSAGRRLGSVRPSGDVFLLDAASHEVLAGRVYGGRIWAPDGGGNMIAVGRIRGIVTPSAVTPRSSAGGPSLGTVVRRGAEFDVLRVRDNWVELRLSPTRTGWLQADAISVAIRAATESESALREIEVAVNACITLPDSVPADTSSNADWRREYEAGIQDTPRAPERTPMLAAELRGQRVELRFVEHRARQAGIVAGRLSMQGLPVAPMAVDSAATAVCGGDVYYPTADLRAARMLQSIASGDARLRVSSTRLQRFVIWLR